MQYTGKNLIFFKNKVVWAVKLKNFMCKNADMVLCTQSNSLTKEFLSDPIEKGDTYCVCVHHRCAYSALLDISEPDISPIGFSGDVFD